MGNDETIRVLKQYGGELEEKAKSQTEEIRRLVENELKDIEHYVKSLEAL